MRAFLIKWFSGPRFWSLLGFIELILLIIDLIFPFMGELMQLKSILLMWIAFATAEILETINEKRRNDV